MKCLAQEQIWSGESLHWPARLQEGPIQAHMCEAQQQQMHSSLHRWVSWVRPYVLASVLRSSLRVACA